MPELVKSMVGKKLLIKIGDGATPEVFADDCLVNTERGIAFSTESTPEVIPYCDTPDSPGWTVLTIDGLSAAINGAGKLHTASVKTWFNWLKSGLAKNIRVELVGVTLANGGGYWQGAFKLTTFEVTGPETGRATTTVALANDGEVTWVDASA